MLTQVTLFENQREGRFCTCKTSPQIRKLPLSWRNYSNLGKLWDPLGAEQAREAPKIFWNFSTLMFLKKECFPCPAGNETRSALQEVDESADWDGEKISERWQPPSAYHKRVEQVRESDITINTSTFCSRVDTWSRALKESGRSPPNLQKTAPSSQNRAKWIRKRRSTAWRGSS